MALSWKASPTLPALVQEIVQKVQQEISGDPISSDLVACGSPVAQLVCEAADIIGALIQQLPVSEKETSRARIILQSLFSLANDSINTLPFHAVDRKWLRLYTDSSILDVILDLCSSTSDVIRASKAVERLDRAIIIAGALGYRRMAWIQALISSLQSLALPRLAINNERPAKRRRFDLKARQTPLYAASKIPTLNHPPSLAEYVDQFSDRPFILRGFISSGESPVPRWPALDRWGSAEYLLDQVGEGRVVPVEVGASYDDDDWGQNIVPLRDFLHRAGYDVGFTTTNRTPLYLAQYPLFNQFPQLEKDIALPDYIWTTPPAPSYAPDYVSPNTASGVEINVWIGSGGGEIVSPAHTDPYFNCYAQVLGRKRVWLAPPACSTYMQVYAGEDSQEDEASLAQKYMTNTSTVPVLRTTVSGEELRLAYPDYSKHVWPHSLEAVLEPGDVLMMPPKWWHAMRGEGEGAGWSVSIWY